MGRSPGSARRGYFRNGKLLAVALVKVGEAGRAPRAGELKLSFDPAVVGQRIAVVGFPKSAPLRRDADAVTAAFSVEPMGQKDALPGEITEVSRDMIEYAAFTLGGTSGGPVVDLDSGAVIGVHFAGRFDEGDRHKVWLRRFRCRCSEVKQSGNWSGGSSGKRPGGSSGKRPGRRGP